MTEDAPYIGPTGQFPNGKIDETDEGELNIAICYDRAHDCLVIEFGTTVSWIALSREGALEFAKTLADKVTAIEVMKYKEGTGHDGSR